jgi:hypothetical protein
MFLVEMAFNTIKEEIQELEMSNTRKEVAIKQSKLQLKADTETIERHVENDNLTTSN